MTAFSQMAPPSDFDTNCHLAKLRTRIPSVLFSFHHKPTSLLHNNYLCKPNSLTLIMNQELKLPDVMCSGCELKSANCLDCKYLKNETSPVDQANLSILRNSIKLLRDPVDSTKQIIEIDYKFQVSPFIAFRPQLSNHLLGKSTSLALYKRLKKRNLLEQFHTKITEGMVAGHSIYITPAKEAELDKLPKYYCSLNFVKKLRPTSNFSAPIPQVL